VKALKKSKDLLLIFSGYSHAVVLNAKYPIPTPQLGPDVDLKRIAPAIPDRISNQVLEKLLQLKLVKINRRQIGMRDSSTTFVDRSLEISQSLLQG